jgi:hypothetical protein
MVRRAWLRLSSCVMAAGALWLVASERGVISSTVLGASQSIAPDHTIARLSDYVEQYYTRAQSIVANESVTVHQMRRDLTVEGFARRLVYELRIEWDPSVSGDESPAKVTRQLLTVNGKPPRKGDEPECTDPRSVSPEPLAFLLPDRRHKFAFTSAGVGRVDRRDMLMVDFRSLEQGEPKVEWTDKCITVDVVGRARGRVWADPETAAIVRLDEQLTGMVDFPVPRKHQRVNGALYMTLERSATSIRYRPVKFSDPDETLMLPAEIISSWMFRAPGSVGTRVTQSFSNYRRFVTAGRIID